MHNLTAMQDAMLTVASKHHHKIAAVGQWKHMAAHNPGMALGLVVIIAVLLAIGVAVTRSS
jgi:hypothetical protein